MSITVNAPAGEEAQALARSSRQVARAVKQALLRVGRTVEAHGTLAGAGRERRRQATGT